MTAELRNLPIDERIRLVEDLWDSIAAEQEALPLTNEQRAELDRRLASYESDGNKRRVLANAIADIRERPRPLRFAFDQKRTRLSRTA